MQYLLAGIVWWKKNRKRKRLSASEYFFNADTADITDEELEKLNNEKEMMIWIHNYLWVICDLNDLNTLFMSDIWC